MHHKKEPDNILDTCKYKNINSNFEYNSFRSFIITDIPYAHHAFESLIRYVERQPSVEARIDEPKDENNQKMNNSARVPYVFVIRVRARIRVKQ